MGKFVNTKYNETIDIMVDNLKNLMNNPYYKWSDKSGTSTTYYNQNKEKSTLDEGSKLQYNDLDNNCPTWYNQIDNLFIYGLEAVSINMENGDYGASSGEISGEGIILPNTIVPYPGDYFKINYLKEKTLLFRVNDVSTDTLEVGSNIYKISYILETSGEHEIPVADKYNMVIENVGTSFNSIIRSESYNLIESIDNLLITLKKYYKALFYQDRVQTFIYRYEGSNFYDPYMVEFIRDNKLMDGDGEYVYIGHQTKLSPLFPIKYNKTFFRCIECKDLSNIRKYIYQGTGEYIDNRLTIFNDRVEDYFEIVYNEDKTVNFGIIPCFSDTLISRIEAGNLMEEKNIFSNILIKYFNDMEIINSDIERNESIDYNSNIALYYLIPSAIYCLEWYIKKLMSKEQ